MMVVAVTGPRDLAPSWGIVPKDQSRQMVRPVATGSVASQNMLTVMALERVAGTRSYIQETVTTPRLSRAFQLPRARGWKGTQVLPF